MQVRNAGVYRPNQSQRSMDLLKKEEKNLVEPLVGLSKVVRGVLQERGGI